MRIGFEKISPLFLVAFVTDIGLCCLAEHRVAWYVNLVATDAGQIVCLVFAPCPANASIALMAIQADLVLLLG